jgi:hypothetical protein
MKNFDKIKGILIELMKEEYLLRENSKNWYKLKEFKDEIYMYFKEKFGYTLVVSNNMAKLLKYSVVGDKNKGIESFEKNEEYAILALSLDFLEDKYDGETILISQLLEYIVGNYPIKTDWKDRGLNLALVRVLRYCESKKILKKLDGSENDFLNTDEELLYENTGFSKYFMNDILSFDTSQRDILEKIANYNIKDLKKEQIIRRTLLENFIVTSDFSYYNYLLEHRDSFAQDFQDLLDMRLITFKEFSYLIKEEESSNVSKSFPSRNNIEKLLILFFNRLESKEYTITELVNEFSAFKFEYKSLFTKENLNKDIKQVLAQIIIYSEKLNISKVEGDKVFIGEFVKHFEVDLIKGETDE